MQPGVILTSIMDIFLMIVDHLKSIEDKAAMCLVVPTFGLHVIQTCTDPILHLCIKLAARNQKKRSIVNRKLIYKYFSMSGATAIGYDILSKKYEHPFRIIEEKQIEFYDCFVRKKSEAQALREQLAEAQSSVRAARARLEAAERRLTSMAQ